MHYHSNVLLLDNSNRLKLVQILIFLPVTHASTVDTAVLTHLHPPPWMLLCVLKSSRLGEKNVKTATLVW
jgi:hypothetical protein